MVDAALESLGMDIDIEIFGNPRAFYRHGVDIHPALMVDGQILVAGTIPTIEELIEVLKKLG
ncbi:MAG: thioredoxin family protein [Tissierellaceae bacterium]